MNDQLTFADTPGLVRADHPTTSYEAANSIKTGSLRWRIFQFIWMRGDTGATDDEILERFEHFGYTASSTRPRRVELERDGKIVRSTLERPTRSGRRAIVFVATPWILDTKPL